MKAYWQQLNEREQAATVIAAVLFVLYFFYAVIYSPMVTSLARADEDFLDKKTTLAWMQQAEKNFSQGTVPKQVTAGNLLSTLTTSLEKASFHRFPYELAQTASGDIQLTFVAVPYNAFMTWLQKQSTQYTFTIKTMDLYKTDMSGVVKATVMFAVH